MKRKMRKFLLTLSAALLLVTLSVGVTVAYLTDSEAVTNTFTVGQVHIKLDEADVYEEDDIDGTNVTEDMLGKVKSTDRVTENEYKLIPGHTYTKDPTVTVLAGSETCYVRAFVEISFAAQIEAIANAHGLKVEDFVGGIGEDWKWTQKNVSVNATNNTMTYEVWYNEKVAKNATQDTELEPIFSTITMPGVVTKEELATLVTYKTGSNEIDKQLSINVTAQAIQADGFQSAENAWKAFPQQNP